MNIENSRKCIYCKYNNANKVIDGNNLQIYIYIEKHDNINVEIILKCRKTSDEACINK